MLVTSLDDIQPTHVVVAWDLPVPTFRHEKYIAYKAQRPKADAEMVDQISLVKDIIATMGITQMEKAGYEADDIIGTLSIQKEANVVILTGDQDTMQLVKDNVIVMTPAKGKEPSKLYGPVQVREKYGVLPEQIVDYKALIGDHSDNIPGVAGIGPKTAAILIQQFGTLENLYEHIDQVPEKQRVKLIDGKDSAFMSQDLSRIVTDVSLDGTIDDWVYTTVATDAVKAKLEELNFKSLLRRLFPWEEEQKKKKIPDSQMGLF
jgi:DNA polymerase-1